MTRVTHTFRHPHVSLWQSAVLAVERRQPALAATESGAAPGAGLSQRTAAVAAQYLGEPGPAEALGFPVRDAARVAFELALAMARGDQAEVDRLRSELEYLDGSPVWLVCVAEYARLLAESGGQQYYPRHASMNDFLLDLPPSCTIALLADWGTGTPAARALMQQVALLAPDVILHLGDVYYSGTPEEMAGHLLSPVDDAYPDPHRARPRVFTLSGNHDRYCGGAGLRNVFPQIHQPATYFCLRNADWQLLAMDTGLHDAVPGDFLNLTRLEDGEVAWHQDKLQGAGGRGTILLSHHQLFSAGGVGRDGLGPRLAVNPHLYAAFAPWLPGVAWWFWGHEHVFSVYEPYVGLPRGRCIGAGAIPVFPEAAEAASVVPGAGEQGPPRLVDAPGTTLGTNGDVYNHVFVLLRLRGPAATAEYYQLPVGAAPSADLKPTYTESVRAPS